VAGKPDRHLSVRDAAITLGVPDTTVRLWLDRGDLTAVRAAGGVPAVTRTSVDRMLTGRRAHAGVRLAVTVGALKGGVGKSMTVWRLANLLAGEGARVLVIDADPNSQTILTAAARYSDAGIDLPWQVRAWAAHDPRPVAGVRALLDDVDHVLVDTGPDGADLSLLHAGCRIAPVLLMPVAPRDMELGRLPATVEAARRGSDLTGQPVWPVVLLNRVSLRSPAGERARADLAAAPVLGEVPVLDCEVRDLTMHTALDAPGQGGDYVGVLHELRAFTAQIGESR
jgi:chromosome partitioning protein